ncbi:MAG: DUF86 domain-containing protein [Campylobacterales bacterium]|nr:DUF86 domain-containing protein [Campylobacterales bacterium]
MSKDLKKIEFILENINNISIVIERHGGITKALDDRAEGRPAILMALMQIGENLNKLENIYEELEQDDIRGSYQVRNFIAHDYMGVDIGLIENILRTKLPILKQSIEKLISE